MFKTSLKRIRFPVKENYVQLIIDGHGKIINDKRKQEKKRQKINRIIAAVYALNILLFLILVLIQDRQNGNECTACEYSQPAVGICSFKGAPDHHHHTRNDADDWYYLFKIHISSISHAI